MKVEYKKAIVTFLDVLGFGQQVENSRSPDNILKLLRKTTRKTKASSAVLKLDGTWKTWTTTRTFSDLVVRHTEIAPHHTNLIERLNIEIHFLVQMQCDLLARDGILLRGGVCLRASYIDDEFIFGPALNQSYRLEHQVAVYPRIVIDKQLITQAESETGKIWPPSLKRGDDGATFVNYLYGAYKYADANGFIQVNFKNRLELLSAHKSKIQRELNRRRLDERARQKWLWAGLYHNSVLERLISERENIQSFYMIPEGVLK
jgi:hypothetical protein